MTKRQLLNKIYKVYVPFGLAVHCYCRQKKICANQLKNKSIATEKFLRSGLKGISLWEIQTSTFWEEGYYPKAGATNSSDIH